MGTGLNFEQLEIWQKARVLAKDVYKDFQKTNKKHDKIRNHHKYSNSSIYSLS